MMLNQESGLDFQLLIYMKGRKMKKRLSKVLLFVMAICLTTLSANAQRDRNYVKNCIKEWGTCKNVAITKTNGDVALYGRCGYAASNSNWTTALWDYSSTASSNWLYLDLNVWAITRDSATSKYAFYVNFGRVNSFGVGGRYAVRPSFYLTSSTTYVSGSGSSADPIRIS